MPLELEAQEALNELRTWASLHDADIDVFRALVTLDKLRSEYIRVVGR